LAVFWGFRHLLEVIQALTEALQELATIQRGLGPATDRLEVLERSRHQFEAECEGMLLKADGKLKAAASAEARERQLKKANDRVADPLDPDGVEEPERGVYVLSNDAQASKASGVPAVHMALATNSKAQAVRAKFGI